MGTKSHVSRSDFLSQVKIGKNKNIQNQMFLWNRFEDVCDPVKKGRWGHAPGKCHCDKQES